MISNLRLQTEQQNGKKNPIPEVYDDHFKLHPNSVQFGLDIALNLVTATIEELQNRNDELNEDGTYGYEQGLRPVLWEQDVT